MLTVLLATRNGARTLPAVLEAYRALEAPAGGWNMVIVDNGSSDDSRAVITSFEAHLPLTYVFEPGAGKNRALNTGLGFVSGDLVVFTDDDTFPRPDWLVRLRDVADAHPSFGMFAGTILPRWETSPPAWILKWVHLAPSYALTDPSLPEGPTDGYHVFGPNMAVQAQIFHTGFNVERRVRADHLPRRIASSIDFDFS